MISFHLSDIISNTVEDQPLWTCGYKIPWDNPAFSKRMLREHLTQEHDMASRKRERIALQADWLHESFLAHGKKRILDLGCGPGLYAPYLVAHGHHYLGIDFSPASIAHAQEHFASPSCCFVLGDLQHTSFEKGHDLVMFLYGELNVFPEAAARRILSRAWDALKPGGVLLLEAHTREAVAALGSGASWSAAASGLFGDAPHLCLVKNQWFAAQETARQFFYIIDAASGNVQIMCSTTKAYTGAGYVQLLKTAGFTGVALEPTWPGGRDEFLTITARKPVQQEK